MELSSLQGTKLPASELYLSSTAESCLFTKEASSTGGGPNGQLQRVPGEMYVHPSEDIRKLAAKLILEEAVELVNALGFFVIENPESDGDLKIVRNDSYRNADRDLFDVIDGACDTSYVATWILCAYGVPDVPHMKEVCRANDAKFPGGKAIIREDGKFLKPEGWKGPDHAAVKQTIQSEFRSDAMKEQAVYLHFDKVSNEIESALSSKPASGNIPVDGRNEGTGPG